MYYYNILVEETDIDKVLDFARKSRKNGNTVFPGMTYEEGILIALEWILGLSKDDPCDPIGEPI